VGSLELDFSDVWFNAPGQRRVRGAKDRQALAEMLGAPGFALPRNPAFGAHA
jgi:hypothetical protein